MTKDFWKAAVIRAVRTIAQSMISMIAVGAALSEVQWLRVLSVSAVAGLLSILTSIATGLPEVEPEEHPTITFLNTTEGDEDDEAD